MHLVDVVLFAHIIVAIAAFCVAGILHTAQWVARGATSTSTLKAWSPVIHRLEPLFPVLALVLFGLGAWLLQLSDGKFRWGDGWVISAVVGLAVMEAVGGVLIAPRSKALVAGINGAGEGPVDAALHAAILDRAFWVASHFATAVALGIVYLMAAKPGGAASVAVLLVAAALGVAAGAAGARDPKPGYRVVGAAAVSAGVGEGQ
jgi:hypothetical protein